MSHTPGPWIVDRRACDDDGDIDVLILGSASVVARVISGGKITAQERADAQLIATSPKLLGALRHLVAAVDATDNRDDQGLGKDSEEMVTARAVLAEAEAA